MRICIDLIPHAEHRYYGTCGDWQIDAEGNWNIKVSQVQESGFIATEYSLLIAIHELIEMALCWKNNISPEAVDHFDIPWKPHDGIQEPGDDDDAPYYAQHQFACGIERQMAAALGVNWKAYEQAVDAL